MAITNADNFADFVDRRGTSLKYHQARLCSCVGENDGQPDPADSCDNGWRFTAPVSYKLLRTAPKLRFMPSEWARIMQGGCQMSIPQKKPVINAFTGIKTYSVLDVYERAAVGDVFVLDSRTRRASDILRRGTRDVIGAFDVQVIHSVAKQGTIFAETTNYTLSGDKRTITWVSGGPAVGERYTVEFTSLLEYVIWDDMAKDRGSDAEVLPKRVMCKLRQYIDFDAANLDALSGIAVQA